MDRISGKAILAMRYGSDLFPASAGFFLLSAGGCPAFPSVEAGGWPPIWRPLAAISAVWLFLIVRRGWFWCCRSSPTFWMTATVRVPCGAPLFALRSSFSAFRYELRIVSGSRSSCRSPTLVGSGRADVEKVEK